MQLHTRHCTRNASIARFVTRMIARSTLFTIDIGDIVTYLLSEFSPLYSLSLSLRDEKLATRTSRAALNCESAKYLGRRSARRKNRRNRVCLLPNKDTLTCLPAGVIKPTRRAEATGQIWQLSTDVLSSVAWLRNESRISAHTLSAECAARI